MHLSSTIQVQSTHVPKSKTALSVCLVTDDFLPAKTGVGVHVQKIAPQLVRQGHQVIVLTARQPGQPAFETWNGVHIYRFFCLPVAGFYQALPSKTAIAKILSDHQVDAVHLHYLGFMMVRAVQAARSLGIRTVWTAHMTVDVLTQPLFMKPFHGLLTWGYRRILQSIDSVVCVSPQQVNDFKGYHGSITVISNPIDFRGDEALPVPRSDRFTVLYVGRLEQNKNVKFLVAAFQKLVERHPDLRLQIAGVGVEEQALRRQVGAARLNDSVSFLGHVPHDKLPALYAAASVFVLPSLLEAQPLVVLEAMKFRLPVIVTNAILSARDLVEQGVNGYIVDQNSVQDLIDKLTWLYDNPALRRQMGETGFSHFSGETSEGVGEKLEILYKYSLPVKGPYECHQNESHRTHMGNTTKSPSSGKLEVKDGHKGDRP